ncbi:MAG: ABC transporter permease, partial [Lachnospiraceae bacterium]|nr:ABC transporter permease [Lachnospiraceae bacterium]
MIVSIKDIFKMIGIMIVSFCAVIVCAMFLNYYLDLVTVENLITNDISKIFYDAQCSSSKVVSRV